MIAQNLLRVVARHRAGTQYSSESLDVQKKSRLESFEENLKLPAYGDGGLDVK